MVMVFYPNVYSTRPSRTPFHNFNHMSIGRYYLHRLYLGITPIKINLKCRGWLSSSHNADTVEKTSGFQQFPLQRLKKKSLDVTAFRFRKFAQNL